VKYDISPSFVKSAYRFGRGAAVSASIGILVLLPLAGVVAQDDPLPGMVEKIKPSIVAIGTYESARRPPSLFRATGFAVADGSYIVTNAHALPETMDASKNEQLAVFSPRADDVDVRAAVVVTEDWEHDLALLKIAGLPLPPLTLGDSDAVREGELHAFIGFPIGSVLGLYPATHRGTIAAITPIVVPAASSRKLNPKLIKRMLSPYRVFQLDATAYPGNSGSPVFRPQTGEVVGVINKVFVRESKESALTHPSGITYAVPSRFVRQLLKQANVMH